MKFAFLIGGELRGVKKTIDTLYKYIIDYYNADVFILCQKTFDDDDERLSLFNRNVIYSRLYDKPETSEYFNNINIYLPNKSWNKPGNLQIYINMNEYAKVLETHKDNYDYFIHFRPDIEILFPFPNKETFENIPNHIYIFDPNYCKQWGGLGIANFIHKDFVIDYFKSCYDMIIEKFNNSIFLENNIEFMTQEFFLKLALQKKNIKMDYIKDINFYYTAESINSKTTMSKIKIHSERDNILCKYEQQVNEAYSNLELWNNNFKWEFKNNYIGLFK